MMILSNEVSISKFKCELKRIPLWIGSCFLFLLFFGTCQSDPGQVEEKDASERGSITLPPPEEDFDASPFKWGFMDTSGELVIEDDYDEARSFSEGMAVVRIKGRWGFIDRQGKVKLPIDYPGAWSFSEGLARVQTYEDKMGFIDKEGNWIIEPDYEDIQDFEEGLARFRSAGLFGFIDRQGTVIIEPTFENVSSFTEGYATV